MVSPKVTIDFHQIMCFASLHFPADQLDMVLEPLRALYNGLGYSTGTSKDDMPSVYIVRQPAPRLHRKGWIEGQPGLNGKKTIAVMQKVLEDEDGLVPILLVETLDHVTCDASRVVPQQGEGSEITMMMPTGDDPAIVYWIDSCVEALEELASFSPEEQNWECSEDDRSDKEDDSNEQPSKRSRAHPRDTTTDSGPSGPELSKWFRPKMQQNGEVQFEIWVVAFKRVSEVKEENQKLTEDLDKLLDSKLMKDFVRHEVAHGRIGIDFKKVKRRMIH